MTDIENKIREAWNAQNTDDHSSPSEWTRFVMTGWGGYCERMEVVRSFRKGFLASRQEAAAQIAEKEYYLNARIAVLESDNRDARSSRDDYANYLKGQKVANDNLRSVVDSQISRIAEKDAEIERLKKGKAQWKQMAELRLQEMKEVVSEYVQELTAARERGEKLEAVIEAYKDGWGVDPYAGGFSGYERALDEAKKSLATHDASRAEKKEVA